MLWASPPCEEFTRSFLPWLRGKYPDPNLDLVKASLRIVRQCNPRYWAIENVKGSIRWLRPLLGEPKACYGPVVLWGKFPHFTAHVEPWKERLSSRQRAERAKIPESISGGLLRAIQSPSLF